MTYGQGLLSGCVLTAFIVILSPLHQFLTLKVISPNYLASLVEYTVAGSTLTAEQARQQFSLGNHIVTGLIAGTLMGMLFSAIIAAFTRSRNGSSQ